MSESYSRVAGRFWIDTKTWGERNQRVALYLLTNKHRTMEGLYYLPLGYLCEDLGLAPNVAREAVAFIESQAMVAYDDEAQVVFLRAALAHGAPKTPMHVRGALRRLRDVRASKHWDAFLVACDTYASELANAIRMEWPHPLESSFSSSSSISMTAAAGAGEPEYPVTDALPSMNNERIAEAVAILRTCSRIRLDCELMGVANALNQHPKADAAGAARRAIVIATSKDWTDVDSGRVMWMACRDVVAEHEADLERQRPRSGNGPRSVAAPKPKPWAGAMERATNPTTKEAA